MVKPQNKQITKGIDIIIKYLNGGGEWVINKGWMVLLNQNERVERKKERALKAKAESSETPVDDNVTTTQKYQANPFDALDVNSPSNEDDNSSADSSDIDIDAI